MKYKLVINENKTMKFFGYECAKLYQALYGGELVIIE